MRSQDFGSFFGVSTIATYPVKEVPEQTLQDMLEI